MFTILVFFHPILPFAAEFADPFSHWVRMSLASVQVVAKFMGPAQMERPET